MGAYYQRVVSGTAADYGWLPDVSVDKARIQALEAEIEHLKLTVENTKSAWKHSKEVWNESVQIVEDQKKHLEAKVEKLQADLTLATEAITLQNAANATLIADREKAYTEIDEWEDRAIKILERVFNPQRHA